MKTRCIKWLSDLSDIYFLSDYRLGAGLLLILCIHPRLVLSGVLAILAAHGFACLNGRAARNRSLEGIYTYNPFLAGLAVGACLEFSIMTVGLACIAGVLAFLATALIKQLAEGSLGLPAMSLPFALVSLMILFIANQPSQLMPLLAAAPEMHQYPPLILQWIPGYLRSLGAIVFVSQESIGLLLAMLILWRSWILFGLSVGGYWLGAGLHGVLFSTSAASIGVFGGLNFILTAMALGGVFFTPSWQSLFQAGVGVLIAVLTTEAMRACLAASGLPVLSLPFVAAVWLVCLGARILANPMIPLSGGCTPEEMLENNLVVPLRFHDPGRILHPPFAGEWTVWQGVGGDWTHQGPWKHALDFVITDADGKTFRNNGRRLTDYFAYGKPVLAPCDGQVVKVINDIADNPAGQVNQAQPWGNLVIIEHPQGWFVELSHFAAGSIAVIQGQSVLKGAMLGKCGNSGYSAQPHIHIQAQPTAIAGAPTLPFCLSGFSMDDQLHSAAIPPVNSRVRTLWPEPELEQKTRFRLGDVFRVETFRGGVQIDRTTMRVALDIYGAQHLATDQGKLYFETRGDAFYFYRITGDDPLLQRLFVAMPKIPLVLPQKGCWRDWIPTARLCSPWRRRVVDAVGVVYPKAAVVTTTHRLDGINSMQTRIHSKWAGENLNVQVKWGEQTLLNRMVFDDLEIRFVPQHEPARAKERIPMETSGNSGACDFGFEPCTLGDKP